MHRIDHSPRQQVATLCWKLNIGGLHVIVMLHGAESQCKNLRCTGCVATLGKNNFPLRSH